MKKHVVFLFLCLSTSCIVQAMKRERDIPQEESLATKKAKKETLEQRLFTAIKQGDKEAVKMLLDRGANYQCMSKYNDGITDMTPLMVAALNGHKEIVEMLIAYGVEVNAQGSNGVTALVMAVASGDKEIVEMLLARGAEVNIRNNQGCYTALMAAAEVGNKEIVEILLARGADVNARDILGNDALIWAVWKRYKELVKILLENKASFLLAYKVENIESITPLMSDSQNSQKELVKTLLAHSADVNIYSEYDETNLKLALSLERGPIEIVELLLAHKADVHTKNRFGQTALMVATEVNWKEIVEILITRGADVNAKDMHGNYALMWSVNRGYKELVKVLLENKAHPHLTYKVGTIEGVTPLMSASQNGYKEIVEMLLAHGAAVNAQNSNGDTALVLAIAKGRKENKEVVRILLENKANPHFTYSFQDAKDSNESTEDDDTEGFTTEDTTPLMWAARMGYKDIAIQLLKAGVNVNSKDEDDWTALLYAASGGYKDIVEVLIASGADVNAKAENDGNLTVLMAAAREGYKDVVIQLLDAGADINAKDYSNESILMQAASNSRQEVVSLLLKRGAQFTVEDIIKLGNNFDKLSLECNMLLSMCSFSSFNHYRMALLSSDKEQQAKLFCQAYHLKRFARPLHHTLLIWASILDHKEVVEELLKGNLPLWYLNAQDDCGRTALMYAIIFGNEDVAKLLIQAYEGKAKHIYENLQKEGNPVKKVQLQQELGRVQRAINICDKYGKSALAYGVEKSKLLVSRLLQAGARPGILLMNAIVQQGQSDILVLLIQKGFLQPNIQQTT